MMWKSQHRFGATIFTEMSDESHVVQNIPAIILLFKYL